MAAPPVTSSPLVMLTQMENIAHDVVDWFVNLFLRSPTNI